MTDLAIKLYGYNKDQNKFEVLQVCSRKEVQSSHIRVGSTSTKPPMSAKNKHVNTKITVEEFKDRNKLKDDKNKFLKEQTDQISSALGNSTRYIDKKQITLRYSLIFSILGIFFFAILSGTMVVVTSNFYYLFFSALIIPFLILTFLFKKQFRKTRENHAYWIVEFFNSTVSQKGGPQLIGKLTENDLDYGIMISQIENDFLQRKQSELEKAEKKNSIPSCQVNIRGSVLISHTKQETSVKIRKPLIIPEIQPFLPYEFRREWKKYSIFIQFIKSKQIKDEGDLSGFRSESENFIDQDCVVLPQRSTRTTGFNQSSLSRSKIKNDQSDFTTISLKKRRENGEIEHSSSTHRASTLLSNHSLIKAFRTTRRRKHHFAEKDIRHSLMSSFTGTEPRENMTTNLRFEKEVERQVKTVMEKEDEFSVHSEDIQTKRELINCLRKEKWSRKMIDMFSKKNYLKKKYTIYEEEDKQLSDRCQTEKEKTSPTKLSAEINS